MYLHRQDLNNSSAIRIYSLKSKSSEENYLVKLKLELSTKAREFHTTSLVLLVGGALTPQGM